MMIEGAHQAEALYAEVESFQYRFLKAILIQNVLQNHICLKATRAYKIHLQIQ